jgi:hypothetical protein
MLTMPTFTVGDTAPPLTGVVTAGGAPVDITDLPVEVHILQPDREVLVVTATVSDGPAGAWEYAWEDPIAQTGIHEVEVQVAIGGTRPETFGPKSFKVRAQFA